MPDVSPGALWRMIVYTTRYAMMAGSAKSATTDLIAWVDKYGDQLGGGSLTSPRDQLLLLAKQIRSILAERRLASSSQIDEQWHEDWVLIARHVEFRAENLGGGGA